MGWVTYEGTEVPFPHLLITQWDDGGGDITWEVNQITHGFCDPNIYSVISQQRRTKTAWSLKALSSLYCWAQLSSFKNWIAEEALLSKLKRKSMPLPSWFLLPPNSSQKQSHLWVFQIQKLDYVKRALCSFKFPPHQGIWEHAIQQVGVRGFS